MGVYQWKSGTRFKADPQKVAAELEGLPEKTPEAALKKARNKKSELHKCAEWDDTKAAEAYRLNQMRSVIRSIVVYEEPETSDAEPIIYRAFEYVTPAEQKNPSEHRRQFLSTPEALNNKDYRREVFGEIEQAIDELMKKAKVYRYLSGEMFDDVIEHLGKAKDAIKN